MTIEEHIKWIVHEFRWSGTSLSRKYDALRELVQAAREEGNEELKKNFKHWTDTASKEGWNEAIEETTKTLEDDAIQYHKDSYVISLIEKVRSLKREYTKHDPSTLAKDEMRELERGRNDQRLHTTKIGISIADSNMAVLDGYRWNIMTDEELNEAVVRKLGWTCRENSYPAGPPRMNWYNEEGDNQGPIIPDYCYNIQAAWEIVESLLPVHAISLTQSLQPPQGWSCTMWTAMTLDPDFVIRADTAPRAICLAFLRIP